MHITTQPLQSTYLEHPAGDFQLRNEFTGSYMRKYQPLQAEEKLEEWKEAEKRKDMQSQEKRK